MSFSSWGQDKTQCIRKGREAVESLRRMACGPMYGWLIYFVIGAFGYGAIELFWRGRTHGSMLLLGGICLLVLRAVSRMNCPAIVKSAVGALAITALEFAVGLVVNRWLGLAVWDYSANQFNVLGQICPLYTGLWLLLCLLIFAVHRGINAAIEKIAATLHPTAITLSKEGTS